MNCKRAKLYVALSMGDDLDDASEAELRTHLRECGACRDYHQQMAAASPPWLECKERGDFTQHDSLWPGLLGKLPARPGRRVMDFNGWWAAVSVIVACFAIALFWTDEAQSGRWSSSRDHYVPPSGVKTVNAGVGLEIPPSPQPEPPFRPRVFFFHGEDGSLRVFTSPNRRPRPQHSGMFESGDVGSVMVPRHDSRR